MSYRNADETAFHILMPALDESAAVNDVEKFLLKELKERYRARDEYQDRLQELEHRRRNVDGDYLRCIRESIIRTVEHINIEDRAIVSLRNEPSIKALYEREAKKAIERKELERDAYNESLLENLLKKVRFKHN